MPQLKKILVPVDFSDGSELALSQALELAARFDAAVEVLHVWEPPRFIRPDLMVWMEDDGAASSLAEYSQKRAAKDLETLVAKRGLELTTNLRPRVEMGGAAAVIVEEAARGEHDLIVMGTHGRSGFQHLFLGSVAEKVVRRAPCPVMTVRSAPAPAVAKKVS